MGTLKKELQPESNNGDNVSASKNDKLSLVNFILVIIWCFLLPGKTSYLAFFYFSSSRIVLIEQGSD